MVWNQQPQGMYDFQDQGVAQQGQPVNFPNMGLEQMPSYPPQGYDQSPFFGGGNGQFGPQQYPQTNAPAYGQGGYNFGNPFMGGGYGPQQSLPPFTGFGPNFGYGFGQQQQAPYPEQQQPPYPPQQQPPAQGQAGEAVPPQQQPLPQERQPDIRRSPEQRAERRANRQAARADRRATRRGYLLNHKPSIRNGVQQGGKMANFARNKNVADRQATQQARHDKRAFNRGGSLLKQSPGRNAQSKQNRGSKRRGGRRSRRG